MIKAKGWVLAILATAAATMAVSADPPAGVWDCWPLWFLDCEVILWIFLMCTFKWSVRLKTCPHWPQGWGTKRPWCWCRTCLSNVHLRLKVREHSVHRNFCVPSAVWHRVYTLCCCALFNLLSLGTCDLWFEDADPCCPADPLLILVGVANWEGGRLGLWAVSENSPSMFGHPTSPVSATERETQSVWVFFWKKKVFCRNLFFFCLEKVFFFCW